MQRVTATELKARLDLGATPLLLDVREDWEVETAAFPGAKHIPMAEILDDPGLVPQNGEVVVICHTGGRSFTVAMVLERAGCTKVANLEGGIAAWAQDVDPSVPMY